MEISDRWAPLLLQAVRDAIRYRELLLQSETARDVEDGEENLIYLGELLAHLASFGQARPIEIKVPQAPEGWEELRRVAELVTQVLRPGVDLIYLKGSLPLGRHDHRAQQHL